MHCCRSSGESPGQHHLKATCPEALSAVTAPMQLPSAHVCP